MIDKDLLDRITRIESRLVRLMLSLRVDPYSSGTKDAQGVAVNGGDIKLPSLDISFTDIRNALHHQKAPSKEYRLYCQGEYLGVFVYHTSQQGG